jgi:hypothetical protein
MISRMAERIGVAADMPTFLPGFCAFDLNPGINARAPSYAAMGMRTLVSVGTAALSLVAVGCATSNEVVYSAVNQSPTPFRRRPASSVEVLIGKPTSHPHVDVGLFEVYQGSAEDGMGRSTEDMIASLRTHAGLRGCDAVEIMDVELAGRYKNRVVRGACEMYTDASPAAAAAPTPEQPFPSEGAVCGAATEGLHPCTSPMVCGAQGRCASPYR